MSSVSKNGSYLWIDQASGLVHYFANIAEELQEWTAMHLELVEERQELSIRNLRLLTTNRQPHISSLVCKACKLITNSGL